MNFVQRDPALRGLLDRLLPGADRDHLEPKLVELGAIAAGELDRCAAIADANPPQLRQYAPDGERVDTIGFHPSYHRMAELAFGEFGLAAMSHRPGVLGWSKPVPHVVKYALSYVFVQAEFGLACPLSMTDSAARVLRRFDPDRFAAEIGALTATDMDALGTGAMFMTEIQGGTDVGRTATVASEHGGAWRLRGKKWFASNTAADFVLTLARVPGQGDGTRGLGMFLMPRVLPGGGRNGYRIDRLKDKLGARSMATGEITLDEAYALPVGHLENGFRQMAEMVNVSRLSNAMRAAALMRRAVLESVEHTRERVVFGRPLFEQPLMRATLLPMILAAEAALGLVLEAAEQLQRADEGDVQAQRLIRVLTPLAKYTLCLQSRKITADAMEIRGGNGYIEDWVNPRLLRDAQLGSIWEGSSNVIALDVLRCLRRASAHRTVADSYAGRSAAKPLPRASGMAADLAQRWETLRRDGDQLLQLPAERQEVEIAGYAARLTRTVMATLLMEQAGFEAQNGRGERKLLVAQAYLDGLDNPAQPSTRALATLDVLADGGHIPAHAV